MNVSQPNMQSTPEDSGANQSVMRDRNERLVLSMLRRQGPTPKAEIARKTGLSAQTVSVIMRALESDGLLVRGEKLRGKIGQPSIPMQLAPGGAYFVGLKVGRRSAELILVDFVGQELGHISQTYAYPTPDGTLAFLETAFAEITADLSADQKDRIAGLGIAIPFFLWEWAAVIGVDDSVMAAWKDRDLRADMQDMFEFPVFLGNDATCACGAELVFGQTERLRDYLYVYMGYFVGGGVVLNGSLFAGCAGNAAAMGSFPMSNPGEPSRQLVDVASLAGLERRLIAAGEDPALMWGNRARWDFDRAIVDDWMSEVAPALAHMILSAISVIDFPAVLIDGNMPETMREELVAVVARDLAKRDLSGLAQPAVLPGSVGRRARPMGAASLPLSKRFMLEN